jgi:cell division protein FtsB
VSALHPADYRDLSEGGLWTSLNRFVATLIVVIVATVIGYRMIPELGKERDQHARIDALRAEVETQKQLLAKRTREEYLLRNDPEYAGLIARDRLDLMKEGETIFRIEPRVDPSKMRLNQ